MKILVCFGELNGEKDGQMIVSENTQSILLRMFEKAPVQLCQFKVYFSWPTGGWGEMNYFKSSFICLQ